MRRKMDWAITALILVNIVVIAGLLTVVVVDKVGSGSKPGHPAQASPSTSPSASADVMPMGLAHIPTSNACVLCHDAGGSAGLKTVPALGHALEGWRACLTCHSNEELGRKAPGHEGISQNECLNCHKEPVAGPTITQPHSRLQDQHCLDCHGNFAHLPSSMASKSETQCTVCHKATTLNPPQFPHAESSKLECRKCHQSEEVGALPIDHALRGDSTCLLCHDIKVGGATVTAPPSSSATPELLTAPPSTTP